MAVENRRVERRRLGLYCNGLVATEMCMCLCMGEAGGGDIMIFFIASDFNVMITSWLKKYTIIYLTSMQLFSLGGGGGGQVDRCLYRISKVVGSWG